MKTQEQLEQALVESRTEDAQMKFQRGDRVQILQEDHLHETGVVMHIDPVYATRGYIDSYLFIVRIDGWPGRDGDAIFSARELQFA